MSVIVKVFGCRAVAKTPCRGVTFLGYPDHSRLHDLSNDRFAGQRTEAAIGVAVLNRMLEAGRPDSVRSSKKTA